MQRFLQAGRKSTFECKGNDRRSTNKSYLKDNKLIFPRSSDQWEGLAPQCRVFATWGNSTFQGLGCLPIKAIRELGLERCEII